MKKLVLILAFVASGFCNGLLLIGEDTTLLEVWKLIKAGADVNEKDGEGFTPLMSAALNNPNPKVIIALVKAGAEVNAKDKDGKTPLMFAALMNQRAEIITALIKAGADVNAKDDGGLTPLMFAAVINSNPELITTLIKAGADVNPKNEGGGMPLMVAAMENQNPGIITALIKAGAAVNAKDEDGMTPLIFAAWRNPNLEIITTLIKGGADINVIDNKGLNILTYAKENPNREILNFFIELDINKKSELQNKGKVAALQSAKAPEAYYVNGEMFLIQEINNLQVWASLKREKKIKVKLQLINKSKETVFFEPEQIRVSGIRLDKQIDLKVYSADEYERRLRRGSTTSNILRALSDAAGSMADTPQPKTTYVSGNYGNYGSTGGNFSGLVTEYPTSKDYAEKRERDRKKQQERDLERLNEEANISEIKQTLLRKNTLLPGGSVSGIVYVEKDQKGNEYDLIVPFGNVIFTFKFKL